MSYLRGWYRCCVSNRVHCRPHSLMKALSCVDIFTSALITDWDWTPVEALSVSTSSLHISLRKTDEMHQIKALSCVDVSTSALKTEWGWMLTIALWVSTSSPHFSLRNTSMIPRKRFLCQVCRDTTIELDLAHGNLQRVTDVGLKPRVVPGTR